MSDSHEILFDKSLLFESNDCGDDFKISINDANFMR